MHSSTSSSSHRIPDGPWKRTWLVAVLLLLGALAGWKALWSSHGFDVALPNSAARWAEARVALRPEDTVLLGTSRIQVGIVPGAWAAETGGPAPVQLALPGTSPLKTLHHLATETDFRGLAVVEIVDMYVFDAQAKGARADEAIAEYRMVETSPARQSEILLARFIPNSLVMRHLSLGLSGVLEAAWETRLPRNPVANMQTDRWVEFENDRLRPQDVDNAEFETNGRPANETERDAILANLAHSVEMIRARGGRVVFVALPACGERREIEERRYPRAQYWDVLARAVAPAPVINVYDYPPLMQFTCTDGSHLDEADARRITRELARMVVAAGERQH